MRLKDLRVLPKVRDSWSYLYLEHCKIERDRNAIAFHDANGEVHVPCASLTCLMLGPGTSITHAAILSLADCGCLVVWCGEQGVRFYAEGMGETRKAANLLHQAKTWSDERERLKTVMRMYRLRFEEELPAGISLQQIRGKEGVRVRDSYRAASMSSGVEWHGRAYDKGRWGAADPVNRALSAANSCLYGICHAAIVSAGFSPAIGYVHTGKMNSFVFDVADFYKTEVTVPAAFSVCAEGQDAIERRSRIACRDLFRETRMLKKIIPDIEYALGLREQRLKIDEAESIEAEVDGGLWDPQLGVLPDGINYSESIEPETDK